ncbi:MAG: hypothetical protein Q8R69_01500, partial [Telluria sp.]|nr:hypothetical protein [Telluria sp.]
SERTWRSVESKIHTGGRAFKSMSSVFISILKIKHQNAHFPLTWVDWGRAGRACSCSGSSFLYYIFLFRYAVTAGGGIATCGWTDAA